MANFRAAVTALAILAILYVCIVFVPDCHPAPKCEDGTVAIHIGNAGDWGCVPGHVAK